MKLRLFVIILFVYCPTLYSQCDCFIYPIKNECRKNCGLKILNEGSSELLVKNFGIQDSTAQIIIDYRSKKNITALEDLKTVLPGESYLEFDDAYAFWNRSTTDEQRKLDMMADIKKKKEEDDKIQQSAKKESDNKRDFAISKDSLENTVFTSVDEMPEFPGGIYALSNFIATNLKYPASAKDASFTGKVYVGFIVMQDGSLSDIKIEQGLPGDIGADCNTEALRLVNSMPKWRPGKLKGNVVKVAYKLPVLFMIIR